MISLALKSIVLPLLFLTAHFILPSVYYGTVFSAVLTILILMAIGIPMEKLFLKPSTFWTMLVLDFSSTVLVIWFLALFFRQSEVTFSGALILSVFIAAAEYFVHRALLAKST